MNTKSTRRGFTQTVVKNQVILNLIQDLQRLLWLFLNGVRGRCQIKFGMTSLFNNGGFTLIELLVVVLIIGILAAVAVPQYQKAVEKARMTEAISLVRQIASAHQLYYLANSKFLDNTDWDKIDITIPGEKSDTSYAVGINRLRTKYFIYSLNASTKDWLAGAYRVTDKTDGTHTLNYRIWISKDNPTKISCSLQNCTGFSSIQEKLCVQLNAKGNL